MLVADVPKNNIKVTAQGLFLKAVEANKIPQNDKGIIFIDA